VLQCTTAYPSAPEDIGLNVLGEMRDRYECPVGLSDHSGTIYPSIAAAAFGASILEMHVTLSREAFGPDVPASVTPEELRRLVEGVRFVERAMHSPVDKDESAEGLSDLRQVFGRSLAPARDLAAGTLLAASDLAAKKPGGGISPDRLAEVTGRRLCRDVRADELLQEADLE
jgi:N,N'-diacetyllegionaminate synthase